MDYKDTPVIAGVGTTARYSKYPNRSTISLSAEALENALTDTGIDRFDLDGLITNMGPPYSVNYDRLCEALNLKIGFSAQYWSHGRWLSTAIQHAAMAVEAGLADYVAAGLGIKFNNLSQVGGGTKVSLSEVGSISEHSERPWYGMTAPAAANALATRYYMEQYGATSQDLANVAKTLRNHAVLDPKSYFSDEISLEQHENSRFIVDPLRLLDCTPLTDGAAFVIITTAERAESLHDEFAHIVGMKGLNAGRENHLFARPGMGIRTQRKYEYNPRVTDNFYDGAGISRNEVDGFYTYDAFSPNVWFALERWGFCPPGEAYRFTRDGNIGLEGSLPVNTHGGLLSNGHISAWNHIVEMYDQLRGNAGKRQLENAEVLQYGTPFGDSIILRS